MDDSHINLLKTCLGCISVSYIKEKVEFAKENEAHFTFPLTTHTQIFITMMTKKITIYIYKKVNYLNYSILKHIMIIFVVLPLVIFNLKNKCIYVIQKMTRS